MSACIFLPWYVKYSTLYLKNNTAMIILIYKIVSALDIDDSVIGVFLDFSNVFDTVDHTILLKYSLYTSKKNVYFNNVTSSYKAITCGYDIVNVSPLLFTISYADDSSFFFNRT